MVLQKQGLVELWEWSMVVESISNGLHNEKGNVGCCKIYTPLDHLYLCAGRQWVRPGGRESGRAEFVTHRVLSWQSSFWWKALVPTSVGSRSALKLP